MTAPGLADTRAPEIAASRYETAVSRLARLGVALAFVGEALTILRANHAWLIHRVPDDGFYYLELGQRLARGEGPTFDGLNVTSGFHPMWQGMVALLARVVPGDDPLVKAALLLALSLFAIAIFIIARMLQRAVGSATAWVSVLVAVHTTMTMRYVLDGMEGAAVVLALAIVLLALRHLLVDPTPRAAAALGGACALAVLTRLDLLAVVWLVPVLGLLRCRRWKLLGWWCSGLAAIGLPAAVWWYVQFDHVFSTSATVKSDLLDQRVTDAHGSFFSLSFVSELVSNIRAYFGELIGDVTGPGLAPSSLVSALSVILPVLALGGLALEIAGVVQRRRLGRDRQPLSASAYALTTMGAVVVLKAALDQVTEPDWALAWYSAPARVTVGVAVGLLAVRGVRWLLSRAQVAGVIAAVSMGIVLLPASTTAWTRSDSDRPVNWYFYDQLDLAAGWMIQEQPPGRYGAKDAGILGYRLDPAGVVNIDGLVNDYEFAEYLETGPTILDRIRLEGIEIYVGRLSPPTRESMSCATTLWTSPGSVPQLGGDSPVYVLDTRNCLVTG